MRLGPAKIALQMHSKCVDQSEQRQVERIANSAAHNLWCKVRVMRVLVIDHPRDNPTVCNLHVIIDYDGSNTDSLPRSINLFLAGEQ